MFGVLFTDNPDDAFSPDNLAMLAEYFYRGSNFHIITLVYRFHRGGFPNHTLPGNRGSMAVCYLKRYVMRPRLRS